MNDMNKMEERFDSSFGNVGSLWIRYGVPHLSSEQKIAVLQFAQSEILLERERCLGIVESMKPKAVGKLTLERRKNFDVIAEKIKGDK